MPTYSVSVPITCIFSQANGVIEQVVTALRTPLGYTIEDAIKSR